MESSRRQHTGRRASGASSLAGAGPSNDPDTGAGNAVVVSMVDRHPPGSRRISRRTSVPSMWTDRWVRDASGAALGVTVAVVCDPLTARAVWLAVYTGLPAATVVVVPVCGSSLLGDDIVVDATRDSVLAAPPIELDVTFDPAQERVLSDHFRRHAFATAHPEPDTS